MKLNSLFRAAMFCVVFSISFVQVEAQVWQTRIEGNAFDGFEKSAYIRVENRQKQNKDMRDLGFKEYTKLIVVKNDKNEINVYIVNLVNRISTSGSGLVLIKFDSEDAKYSYSDDEYFKNSSMVLKLKFTSDELAELLSLMKEKRVMHLRKWDAMGLHTDIQFPLTKSEEALNFILK